MKKFIIAMMVTALTVSAYAMSKDPAAAKTESTAKTSAIKQACPAGCACAACAAKKAECTAEKATCSAEKAACSADKAACDATKAAGAAAAEVKKTECTGGVCPMPK